MADCAALGFTIGKRKLTVCLEGVPGLEGTVKKLEAKEMTAADVTDSQIAKAVAYHLRRHDYTHGGGA
jgi:hypothetical protein